MRYLRYTHSNGECRFPKGQRPDMEALEHANPGFDASHLHLLHPENPMSVEEVRQAACAYNEQHGHDGTMLTSHQNVQLTLSLLVQHDLARTVE